MAVPSQGFRRGPRCPTSTGMVLPVEVRFRNMRSSEAIEAAVREHADKLDRFHPRITSCRVMVEALHRRHEKGVVFHVRVDVTVPGHELVAKSEPAPHHLHEDVFIAVRDAFDEIRRELQDEIRRRRGYVKGQPPQSGEEESAAAPPPGAPGPTRG